MKNTYIYSLIIILFIINIQSKDIILLHDNHKDIPDVLNIILPKLQEKGIDVSRGLNSLFPVYQN